MPNNRELTRSILDLFDQVSYQAKKYNEAFDKLDNNVSIFDKIVKEISDTEKLLLTEKDEFIKEIDSKLDFTISNLNKEKSKLIENFNNIDSLEKYIETYYDTVEQYNKSMVNKEGEINKYLANIKNQRSIIESYIQELAAMREDFSQELSTIKKTSATILLKQSNNAKKEFLSTINVRYHNIELTLQHQQELFENFFKNEIANLKNEHGELIAKQQEGLNSILNELNSGGSQSRIGYLDLEENTNFLNLWDKVRELEEQFIQMEDFLSLDLEVLDMMIGAFKKKEHDSIETVSAKFNSKLRNTESSVSKQNNKNNLTLFIAIISIIISIVVLVIK